MRFCTFCVFFFHYLRKLFLDVCCLWMSVQHRCCLQISASKFDFSAIFKVNFYCNLFSSSKKIISKQTESTKIYYLQFKIFCLHLMQKKRPKLHYISSKKCKNMGKNAEKCRLIHAANSVRAQLRIGRGATELVAAERRGDRLKSSSHCMLCAAAASAHARHILPVIAESPGVSNRRAASEIVEYYRSCSQRFHPEINAIKMWAGVYTWRILAAWRTLGCCYIIH